MSDAFAQQVEAARMGAIFATPGKHAARAYERWSQGRKRARGRTAGLTGAALERAVMGFATAFPEYVVMGA